MGIFKKEEKIPELEPYSSTLERKIPLLPSISNERLNQTIIKNSVEESNDYSIDQQDDIARFKPQSSIPELPSLKDIQNKTDSPHFFQSVETKKDIVVKGPEEVFVKMEKFKQAKKEMEEIKKDLYEAIELLKKFKDLSKKEERAIP